VERGQPIGALYVATVLWRMCESFSTQEGTVMWRRGSAYVIKQRKGLCTWLLMLPTGEA
jgi:hypothetical protein